MSKKSNRERALEYMESMKKDKGENLSSSSLSNRDRAEKYMLESTINFNTLESDLKGMGNTISNIYGGWQSSETMANTRGTIEAMQRRLDAYQTYRKKYGGADLGNIASGYQTVLDDWDNLTSIYGSYKNADAYDKSLQTAQFNKDFAGLTYDEVQAKKGKYAKGSAEYDYLDNYTGYTSLEDFDKALANYEEPRKEKETDDRAWWEKAISSFAYSSDSTLPVAGTNQVAQKITEEEDSYKSELEKAKNLYELNHAGDSYKALTSNADFKQNSKYSSTINEDAKWWQAKIGDETYEYINNVNGIRKDLQANYDSYRTDSPLYTPSKWDEMGLSAMTDEEIGIYNYLYATEGKESAENYLSAIEVMLTKRIADEKSASIEKAVDDSVLSSILLSGVSPVMSVGGGIYSTIDTLSGALSGKEKNPFNIYNSVSNMSTDIREETSENIAEATKGMELFGQNIPSFLYNTGMSMTDSALGASSMGKFFTPLMGANAYQQKAKELVEAGEDADTVHKLALANGVAEALFEYVSIDKLLKIKNVDGLKSFLKQTAKQAGIEASEEILTETSNLIFDGLIRGNNSDLGKMKQDLINRGFSEGEANKRAGMQAFSQVAWAGVGGALSGGGMGGGASLGNYVSNNSTGKQLRANERTQDVLDMFTEEEAETYKLYSEYAKKGVSAENIKNAQLGNLYSTKMAHAQGVASNRKSSAEDVKKAYKTIDSLNTFLNSKGVTTKDGQKVAIEGVKIVDGETVFITDHGDKRESELNLPQNEEKMLEYTKDMDENKANLFVSQYDGKGDIDLYESQFNLAYELGMAELGVTSVLKKTNFSVAQANAIYEFAKDRKYEAKEEAIQAIVKKHTSGRYVFGKVNDSAIDYTNSGKGEVNWSDLTKTQQRYVSFMNAFYTGLGIDLEWSTKGKEEDFHGYYDKGRNKVVLDVYAGTDKANVKDEDLSFVGTTSHEITHWMKDKAGDLFKNLEEYVFESLEQVDGIDRATRIHYEMANNKGVKTEEEAIDEIVARACEEMLSMSDIGKEVLGKMSKAERDTFVGKVREIYHRMIDFVDELLSLYRPNSYESKKLHDNKERLEKQLELWEEAMRKAMATNQAMVEQGLTDVDVLAKLNEIGLDYDAESQTVYSRRSLEAQFKMDDAKEFIRLKEEYIEALMKATKRSKKTCENYLNSLFLVHDMIANDEARLDYEAAVGKSSWVSNSEYGGSVDFSTLCAKRRLFTGTMDAIIEALPDSVLDENDFLDIRDRLLKKELEAPCSMCYVEGSRAKNMIYINNWLTEYKKTNPTWIPRLADFTSTKRLEQTRLNHPEAYKSYQDAMNKPAQRKPKEASVRTDYRGEIKVEFADGASVDIKNKNGGIRFNSFSDFEIIHALDCMQVITDMATVGLAGQGYTKVKEFAECFGNTGMKINLSLVAKGVDANGKLIFDEVNGMKYGDAIDLRNRFSKNVGTVIVVFNNDQLKAALRDNTIDYVLPFHRSQWKKSQYVMMGLPTQTMDYTNHQNDRIRNPKTGRPVKLSKIKYTSTYTNDITGETYEIKDNIMPNQYWDYTKDGVTNANRYLDYINSNKMTPKFSFLLSKDTNGNWVLPTDENGNVTEEGKGYFKTLIDFKMYDNNGVGSPQTPVVPDFNMPYIRDMLNDYMGGHESFPVAHDVAESFVKDYKEKHNIRKSSRSYAPTFYSHMGKVVSEIKQDKLGGNSVVSYLKGKGVKDEEIKWSGIETFLEGKKSVTKAELQEFVNASQLEIQEEEINSPSYDIVKKGKNYDVVDRKTGDVIDTYKYNIFGKYYVSKNQNSSVKTVDEIDADLATNYSNTKWHQYKLNGGENYRELLFKMPNSDYSNNAMENHWDKSGILAHARMQDMQTENGKMLFIEEIQSDWHNAGHKEGYHSGKNEIAKAVEEARSRRGQLGQQAENIANEMELHKNDNAKYKELSSKYNEVRQEWEKLSQEIKELRKQGNDKTAPDAPFKSTYHEYVLKRLLRMASEEGYDSIGWTTGKIQEERYSSEYAEGYRIEYDQDIPKFLKKYGKRWGASVSKTSLNNGEEVWTMDITDAMKDSVLYEGQVMYSRRDSEGTQLTKEQVEYFKDSKVRDKDGNLKAMYHGSRSAGFTVFNAKASDDNISLFFTDKKSVAQSYSSSGEEFIPDKEYSYSKLKEMIENYTYGDWEFEYNGIDFVLERYDTDETITFDSLEEVRDYFFDDIASSPNFDAEGIYKVYLNAKNPLVVECGRHIDGVVGTVSMSNYKGLYGFTYRTELGNLSEKVSENKIDQYLKDTFGNRAGEVKDRLDMLENGYNVVFIEDISINKTFASNYNDISFNGKKQNTRSIAKYAYDNGYDSVIFNNIADNGGYTNNDFEPSTVVVVFDSNQIKSVSNTNPTEHEDIRYSRRDPSIDSWLDSLSIDELLELDSIDIDTQTDVKREKVTRRVDEVNKWLKKIGLSFNGTKTASWTDERIDKYLSGSYYGSSNPNYAQAYITYMTPQQFLSLTAGGKMTTTQMIENESASYGELDFEKLGNSIPLQLDIKEGRAWSQVTGHEGRHRMYLLGKAGFEKVPVLLFDYSTKYDKTAKNEMKLIAQKFNDKDLISKSRNVTITDAIPFSQGNRDLIIEKFGSGTEADIHYSRRGYDFNFIGDKETRERAKAVSDRRLDEYKDRVDKKTKIDRIRKNTKSLAESLNKNSKDKHIPEHLKPMVRSLVQAIDYETKKRDVKGIDVGVTEEERYDMYTTTKQVESIRDQARLLNALYEVQKCFNYVEFCGLGIEGEIENLVTQLKELQEQSKYPYMVLDAMDLIQLNTIDKLVRAVKSVVLYSNKLHTIKRNIGVDGLSSKITLFLDGLGESTKYKEGSAIAKLQKTFNWLNLVPYYAFNRLGEGGQELFGSLQDGWDSLAFNIKTIVDFTKSVYNAKEMDKWQKEINTVTIRGKQYKMTTSQIMSLYCLTKREQAMKHILGFGIRIADFEDGRKMVSQTKDIKVDESDLKEILSVIEGTKAEEVATKLQEFMNGTCKDWGNYVSMERFGYNAFEEDNYFPIEVNNDNIAKQLVERKKNNSLYALLNMGFTKSLNENAKNSIMVKDIFDVFASHSSDMAKYNALGLAVLDFNRVMNHNEMRDDTTYSIRGALKTAYNMDAEQYFDRLIADINGTENVSRDVLGKTFTMRAKLAAIGFNIKTVILQPTAYFKAIAVLDKKYLISAPIKLHLVKRGIQRAKEHCGIALWKSLGFYDTNISRGVEDLIKQSKSLGEKFANASTKLMEIADEITWGTLWNACESEVKDKHKDLKVGSDEYFDAVAERLREVIYATQVVDSTLTRSDMMRSNDRLDKLFTNFGSEPTLAYNMLLDCVSRHDMLKRSGASKEELKKNRRKTLRVAEAYVTTNLVTAIIEACISAFRDDDEPEEDEVIKMIAESFLINMSVIGKIPYLKDSISMLQGYSPSRMDSQAMQSAVYALQGIAKNLNGEGNPVTTMKNIIKTVSYASGIGWYNAYRDLMALAYKLDILSEEELKELLGEIFE